MDLTIFRGHYRKEKVRLCASVDDRAGASGACLSRRALVCLHLLALRHTAEQSGKSPYVASGRNLLQVGTANSGEPSATEVELHIYVFTVEGWAVYKGNELYEHNQS